MAGLAKCGAPFAPSLRRSLLLLLSLAFSATSVHATAQGSRPNCSYFVTNETSAAYYQYYRFYDFRNISADALGSVLEPRDSDNATAAAATTDQAWQYDWAKRDGLRYPSPELKKTLLAIDYQSDNVTIESISSSALKDVQTALAMGSSRRNESSIQSSGIDFVDTKVLYVSLRLRARLTGDPGVCAAFFTYMNDTQEADIEILTRDPPNFVGFNTQPTRDIHDNFIPGSHWNMSLPDSKTRDDWIDYRLDWVEGQVAWYVDGNLMAKTGVNVPVEPSRLSIALWGNGGAWTGPMTMGNSALLEIQWIEMVYNLSGASPDDSQAGNASLCYLDQRSDGSGNWDFLPSQGSGRLAYNGGIATLTVILTFILLVFN